MKSLYALRQNGIFQMSDQGWLEGIALESIPITYYKGLLQKE